MTACLSPGAYLRKRREAFGLSIAQVAADLATEPHIAEHVRAEWVEAIERDAQPATIHTIAALRGLYPFDVGVLATLAAIETGEALPPPRLCRVCACSEHDPCVHHGDLACSWIAADLCNVCEFLDRAMGASA